MLEPAKGREGTRGSRIHMSSVCLSVLPIIYRLFDLFFVRLAALSKVTASPQNSAGCLREAWSAHRTRTSKGRRRTAYRGLGGAWRLGVDVRRVRVLQEEGHSAQMELSQCTGSVSIEWKNVAERST